MSDFDDEAFLAEAIESMLGQTVTDFGFIIIDDGPTDRTAQIFSDYTRRSAGMPIFQHQNRGRADPLNSGIDLARTGYVVCEAAQ